MSPRQLSPAIKLLCAIVALEVVVALISVCYTDNAFVFAVLGIRLYAN